MTKGIFITGTDTGVGKTVVTRAIVRSFVHRGLQVRALKPVESGAIKRNNTLEPEDASSLLRASKRQEPIEDICAYCFEPPVSPNVAASLLDVTIEQEVILSLVEHHRNSGDVVIVEGAGGLLVPLSDTLLYADVVARANLSLVIVSPNILGTINSTLLTIEAARARDISISGVILNRTPSTDLGNAAAISCHGNVPVLGEFPTTSNIEDDDRLAILAEKFIDLDQL